MDRTRSVTQRINPRARHVALLLVGILALSAACGGKDTSKPAAQTGSGTSLGSAEGAVTGTPGSAAVTPAAPAPTAAPASSPAAAPRSTPPAAPPAAPAQTGAIDPCRLVTREEAEASTGLAFGPGQRFTDTPPATTCLYQGQTSAFTVVVGRWPQAGAFYDSTRQETGRTGQDLQGIGDRAFIDLTRGTAVAVLKGDLFLAITFTESGARSTMTEEERRAKFTALARTALSRL